MAPMDDDDDMPQLSGDAMAALKEFYAERDTQQKKFDELKAAAEDQHQKLSMEMFAEDWNASQFWYSDATASALAKVLLNHCGDHGIAVVSAPSVFIQLKNLVNAMPADAKRPELALLEFDDRFAVFKDFYHYDYNEPLDLDQKLKNKFGCIICDPPFLSEECQTKAAETVRWLSRSGDSDAAQTKVIVCTGERMNSIIKVYGSEVGMTDFVVKHTKGLSNEFRCYTNFECDSWKNLDRF